MDATLADLGEDALIERLTAGLPRGDGLVCGGKDDCAVLRDPGNERRYRLLKTDAAVEGVHFSADTDPERAGRKALCRPLSDFAAMGGGEARAALVTFAAPAEYSAARAEGFYEGIRRAAETFGVTVAGGETVSLPKGNAASLTIMLEGSIPREHCVFRSGARLGDAILVTGGLGGSLESGWHLDFQPRLAEARWLVESVGWRPTAMMDLSDGLAKDLPRLARASGGLGYRIDFDAVPRRAGRDLAHALGDGEDYELLFTLPTAFLGELETEWAAAFPGTPLTLIGQITESIETPLEGGWEHFRSRP
ncbi:MAG: thiamine-monophosphate kinase [Verrucomicrobiae bacterium]|nr:thiamine-monophosphate kinase [Verrucomicrobiae bacterium]MCP5550240.1 thiamine-monophosphate kinase [Akkermansiaceae bacterium]